jgi:hypothetical protein
LNFRLALLASAGLFVAAPICAQDAQLAADAKAFGAREAVNRPALSADGTRVLYVTPGAGRKSIAVIGNLNSGQFAQVVGSEGNPDILRWCSFASASRVVCQITGNTLKSIADEPIGFTRLVALNNDGSNPKMLGQTDSFFDARIRQFDASVVDWLDGTGNKVLLQRDYVPEDGKIGTRLVRTKNGLGVDRVDVTSLSSENVETPVDVASDFMSDGRGNVRIMQVAGTVTPSDGTLSGQVKYLYRTPGSRDWQTLTQARYDEFEALAVDADSNQLYALKKKDGRYALYGIKLDGSLSEKLIASNPLVDIDDVVRFGRGQRVIGYTYAEDRRVVVAFGSALEGAPAPAAGRLRGFEPRRPKAADSCRQRQRSGSILFVRPRCEDADPGDDRSA